MREEEQIALFQNDIYIKKFPERVSTETRSFFLALGKNLASDEMDWTGTDSFHTLSISERGLCLLRRDLIMKSKKNLTLTELKEKYVSLREFLLNSEYIGKEGYRTKPLSNGDCSFVSLELNPNKDRKLEILYRNDTHLLALQTDTFLWEEPQLKLLNARYIDGNWKFVGETNKEYQDPKKVYQKLYRQFKSYK